VDFLKLVEMALMRNIHQEPNKQVIVEPEFPV